MSRWQLHSLNARNALTRLLPDIRAAGNRAMARATAVAPVPPFDLVVRAGQAGAADIINVTAPGVISAVIDPAAWDEARFVRALVGTFHHLMRQDRPGPDQTLGEVLVSMGLSAHFVVQVLAIPPEPATQMLPIHGLAGRALREWAREDFDRKLWFMGQGDLPINAGQGFAFTLVSKHLSRNPDTSAASLVHAPAEDLRVTLRALAVEDGRNPQGRLTERSREGGR